MFFGVFIAKKVYEVGDHGPRDTTTVHVLGGSLEHNPKIRLFHRQSSKNSWVCSSQSAGLSGFLDYMTTD
jgi:hypothetical protein